MDEVQLIKRLRTTPPSCLSDFKIKPAQLPTPFDSNPCSVWQIACRCGGGRGRFMGYPLKSYNTDYDGPETFISPLAFECTECNRATELLDTDRDGYHAEVALREGDGVGSAKLRGQGPRPSFTCPGCGAEQFEVVVGFVFWYPDELLEEFDGEWEELFNVFLCYCKCAGCDEVSQPTDFGRL
jgi:hypothetical protein